MDLTPDQLNQLQELGIDISKPSINTSESTTSDTKEIKSIQQSPLTSGQIEHQTISSSSTNQLLKPSINPIVPLLSISGLTLLSFGGMVLFKNKETSSPSPEIRNQTSENLPTPTQVPKSIQHYLLTSQQLFTQALSAQSTTSSNQTSVDLLNQSILAATEAVKQFPSDYRGYDQRGRIYQSLVDSNPKLLTNAISDLSFAAKLNPESAEITRTLATLYAKSGDVKNTLAYLSLTVGLEPTKAQNFYDLARLQTQAGYIPQALETYNRLLTIVADPTQKQQVINEKSSLEKLVSQNSNSSNTISISPAPQISPITPATEGPLLQADSGESQLIIAAPETSKDISVNNLTNSNSLAGTSTLPANTASISIANSQLTSSSQVYLTITKGGKNQSLQVLSKSTNSFVVGLDSPISEDIEFKWWIVN